MTLTHSWNRNQKKPVTCAPPCDQYDGPNIHNFIGLSITGNQLGNAVLTKYTTATGICCYRAVGNFQLNCTYTHLQKFYCCDFAGPTPGICENQANAMATRNPPFCLTARCGDNPSTGQKGWIWELTICGFALENVELVTYLDCAQITTCASWPREWIGLYIGPAYYMWWTPLKCPPDIVKPTDYLYSSSCHPLTWSTKCGPIYPNTDPTGVDTQCMYDQALVATTQGPFSVAQVISWEGDTPPDDCADLGAFRGNYYDCYPFLGGVHDQPLPGYCQNRIDWADECCEVTLSSGVGYPDLT